MTRVKGGGPPPPWGDGEPPCQACGREMPKRYRVACAECWHVWRFGWLLSLADARAYWQATRPLGPWDLDPPWYARIRILRPSKVWVCPCCAHDL